MELKEMLEEILNKQIPDCNKQRVALAAATPMIKLGIEGIVEAKIAKGQEWINRYEMMRK
jgi:hypothetical protein